MKKVLLTTSAIVGLSVPAFAADPTAVSDNPYFQHSHPMTWSGGMSVSLTNLSTKDSEDATAKAKKKDYIFALLGGTQFVALNGIAAPGGNASVGGYEETMVADFDTLAEQGDAAEGA